MICLLPRSVKFPTWAICLRRKASCAPSKGRNYTRLSWKTLTGAIEYTNQNPTGIGAGHNFLVPRPSVSVIPYPNPHISAESCHMKTAKLLCFLEYPRGFTFRSQTYFCFYLHLQLGTGSVLVGTWTKRHFSSLWRCHRFLILTSGPTSGPEPLVDSEVIIKKRWNLDFQPENISK